MRMTAMLAVAMKATLTAVELVGAIAAAAATNLEAAVATVGVLGVNEGG